MEYVRDSLGRERVSERRACRVLGQSRSTQRRVLHVPDDEPRQVKENDRTRHAILTLWGRYGYRRITAMLCREGWNVKHKRIERLWRREGLKVPQKQPKRRRLWFNNGSCIRLRPTYQNHVWSYDFMEDRTHNGVRFRILNIIMNTHENV